MPSRCSGTRQVCVGVRLVRDRFDLAAPGDPHHLRGLVGHDLEPFAGEGAQARGDMRRNEVMK